MSTVKTSDISSYPSMAVSSTDVIRTPWPTRLGIALSTRNRQWGFVAVRTSRGCRSFVCVEHECHREWLAESSNGLHYTLTCEILWMLFCHMDMVVE